MANNKNTLFSTKGFYLGVAIFSFGLCLMVARVVLEISDYNKTTNDPIQETQIVDSNIKLLQEKLDKKIQEQELKPKIDFNTAIEDGQLEVYPHNPINNPTGIISVIEFIDYNCPSCLVDANFTHRILNGNQNIKLISKLNNVDEDKKLHIANIAALVAAKNNKYFEFREKQLTSSKNDLNEIIDNLNYSGVSLRAFRQALTNNPDILLSHLAQDITQAERLKVKSYTIFINNRMFSDDPKSQYNLKDITVYLNNL